MPPYQAEIIELHQFFEDWFNGRIPKTNDAFARFASVIHPHFHIIPPHGTLVGREPLLKNLYHAHNSHTNIRIWIENPSVQLKTDHFLLATYEEHQQTEEEQTQRISSVLFQPSAGTPNNLMWCHVQETWLT